MSFARVTLSNVLWAFAGTAGARLASLAGLVALARILAPEDFGLVAFALVFTTYIETVGDLGAGMALIYWPSRYDDAAQVSFGINIVMGVLWGGMTLLVAPAVAAFFHEPAATPILRTLALIFPIKALGATHDALLQKQLRFRSRLVPELVLAVLKAMASVGLAVAGMGVWSLVWGQIVGLAAWVGVLWWVQQWRPRRHWPRSLMVPMLRYGRDIVAVNILAAVLHHADLIVVGRMLGVTALGLYQIASKVPAMTITVLMWGVNKVLFPVFSRLHKAGDDLATSYVGALRAISLITIPAGAGLVLLAGPIVLVCFGEQWLGSVPILQALAVYTALRSIGSHAGDVLKATGRPGLLATLGLVKGALLLPALVIAGSHGTAAVAWTLTSVTVVTVLLNLLVVCRLIGVGWREVAGALLPAVASSAVLVTAVRLLQLSLLGRPPALELLLSVPTGMFAYALALRLISPETYRQAVLLIRQACRGDMPEQSLTVEAEGP